MHSCTKLTVRYETKQYSNGKNVGYYVPDSCSDTIDKNILNH